MHLLYKCDHRFVKVIINYQIKSGNDYLRRATAFNTNNSIKIISLRHKKKEKKKYNLLQSNCGVNLKVITERDNVLSFL